MARIPGFWDVGPHDPLPVEETWTEFITLAGGKRIADLLPDSPDFNNADFLFEDLKFVVELKEIETEFLRKEAAQRQFEGLVDRLIEDPTWRQVLGGGEPTLPAWFGKEFIRLARPPKGRPILRSRKFPHFRPRASMNATSSSSAAADLGQFMADEAQNREVHRIMIRRSLVKVVYLHRLTRLATNATSVIRPEEQEGADVLRHGCSHFCACSCQGEVQTAAERSMTSARPPVVAPMASIERMRRSRKTDSSAASTLATGLWLEPRSSASWT